MTRHFIIPDTQVKPGVPTEHLRWCAQAIVDYKPDVVVHLGDHWDMPSLSGHERPGSKYAEGARFLDDIDAGNVGFDLIARPVKNEEDKLIRNHEKRWIPRKVYLFGNHDIRVDRAVSNEPKYEGVMTRAAMNTHGWERREFLDIVEIDGINYSHYFSQTHSGKAIGGSIDNRLNKIGSTFVQGHQQGFLYGTRQYPGKRRRHGLVAGSFYQHGEHYRDLQCQDEWRGVVVLNEVKDGDYCIMPLTLEYLRRKYG